MFGVFLTLLACDGASDGTAPPEDLDGPCEPVTWWVDYDGDGFGGATVSLDRCEAPPGYVDNAEDCDDLDADTFPGAEETCDGADQDCDGEADDGLGGGAAWYPDEDSDGFGDAAGAAVCAPGEGWVSDATDCDDADAATHPGAEDICDGVDRDCDEAPEDCGLAGTYALADADLILVGTGTSDDAGADVAGIGDIDGDGRDDIVVHAPGEGHGVATVVFGGVTGELRLEDATVRREGTDLRPMDGAVQAVGDLSGTGAPSLGVTGTEEGRVFLWHGPLATGSAASGTADAMILWNEDYLALTFASDLTGPGDMDGDGYDDLVVTARDMSTYCEWPELLWIFAGPLVGEIPAEDARAEVTAGDPSGCESETVASVGDLDGDGLGEVALVAPDRDTVFLLGAVSGAASLFDVAVIVGVDVPAVADAAGDVNGDGYADLLVGSPSVDAGGLPDAGRVVLLRGSASGTPQLWAQWDGDVDGQLLGVSVAGAGDVDGDSLGDLLFGAAYAWGETGEPGAAFLVRAASEGSWSVAEATARFDGQDLREQAGTVVDSAGDFDGDGLADLLIGAPGRADGENIAGGAYVVFGEQ